MTLFEGFREILRIAITAALLPVQLHQMLRGSNRDHGSVVCGEFQTHSSLRLQNTPGSCGVWIDRGIQLRFRNAFHLNLMPGAVVHESRQLGEAIDSVALLIRLQIETHALADSLSHSDDPQNCSNLRQRGLTRRCIPQYAAGLVTCDRPPLNGRPEIMATSQQVLLHHLNPIA